MSADPPAAAAAEPPTEARLVSLVRGQPGAFEADDDAAEGVVLLASPGEPHVVLADLPAGAGEQRGTSLFDQLAGAGPLGSQFRQEALVGGELVTRQQALPLTQTWRGGSRREPAHPLRLRGR